MLVLGSRARFTSTNHELAPLPNACCLLGDFALFYAKIASAESPDPVTSLIPHHRPDWLSASQAFCFEASGAGRWIGRCDRESALVRPVTRVVKVRWLS